MASLFDTQIDRIKEVIKSFLADLEKREEAADTGRVCSNPDVGLSAVADASRMLSY